MPGSTPRSKNSHLAQRPVTPMSERQQLKLVRQLETGDSNGGSNNQYQSGGSTRGRARSRSCNGRGETQLHKAAIRGDAEQVRHLLDEGADPNVPDFAGWTPLHEACNHGWYDVALVLVQAGASVNARGFGDDTPLHDAVVNGHLKLVQLLVEKGADVYLRNKDGKTPCDVAPPSLLNQLVQSQDLKSGGSAQRVNNSAICEMRRTSPHTKVDKSPRVTLRLQQVKNSSSNEKRKLTNDKLQFTINNMENDVTRCNTGSSASGNNKDDVYEFKSSKEATPVRSPDNVGQQQLQQQQQTTETGQSESDNMTAKRNISEVNENDENNEEDNKKKKRKEGEGSKDKNVTSTSRLTSVRNVNTLNDKTKTNQNKANSSAGNNNNKTNIGGGIVVNTSNVLNTDKKSPQSPKLTDVDTDERSMTDGLGPKVPPLKIVIPQGNENESRNSKSNCVRHHQALPYVVSSNSNDSESGGPRSGSTSPVDSAKSDEKKDPAIGMLSAEDQKSSLHHQRVLRSTHRSGSNGDNGNNSRNGNGSVSNSGTAGTSSGSTTQGNSGGASINTSSNSNTGNSNTTVSNSNMDTVTTTQATVSTIVTSSLVTTTSVPSVITTNLTDLTNNNNNSTVSSVGEGGNTVGGVGTTTTNSSKTNANPAASKPLGSSSGSGGGNGNSSGSSTGGNVGGVTASDDKSSDVTDVGGTNTLSTTQHASASSATTTILSSVTTTASTTANTSAVPVTTATSTNTSSSSSSSSTSSTSSVVDLHPRKRKLKHNSKNDVKEGAGGAGTAAAAAAAAAAGTGVMAAVGGAAGQASEVGECANPQTEVHPHEQPVKNCYQLFLDIRKQIERRRKGFFPVQPKPPQGFKDYLMNRCTYILAGNASTRQVPGSPVPMNLAPALKDQFVEQEKERHRLRLQHVIEKEKLVLSVEQEILRVHGRAARALANQSLPFSVCTILKDEEVYNLITPEQEEKDRNARSRYNGRLFLSWLQDVDDKWEKIKEAMLLRHHNEAESLHAVQKMDWEWKMKELGLCEPKLKPVILDSQVPMVHVSDDFDLLPA